METQIVDLTKEQFDNIVSVVVEKVLNNMPAIMGNLMSQQAIKNKVRKDFYDKHSEFNDHKDVVGHVVSKIEGENLTTPLDIIMERAVPIIKERIKVKESVDLNSVQDLKDVNKTILPETDMTTINESDNGEL